VSEQVFTALEARRQQDQLASISTLAENPTLKAALDTYFTESRFAGVRATEEASLHNTVTLEAEKLADLTHADVLAILDASGHVFASAGPAADRWPRGLPVNVPAAGPSTFQDIIVLPKGAFRISGAVLSLGDRDIGALIVGTNLDATYAKELSQLASADVVIMVGPSIVATTLNRDVSADLMKAGSDARDTQMLSGEEYAVRRLVASGPAHIYTLASIDAATKSATRSALLALGTIALGAFVLAGFGSLWLARTLTDPIDRLAGEIGVITATRDLGRMLRLTGTSRELDTLAEAFNDLMRGLTAAEADTRSAYVGAIRALAAALDARDPYTAGHSDRVSALSVLIGREMKLGETDLDILRLGALLHDIGKIGLSDEILRKPDSLTREEYEQIKRHPALGARILRQVPFLAPHLPIVELHHERPDGRGYPFGLRAEEIPVAARIVHVADAYDAMTSERAYRPALGSAVALSELHRLAGTDFDEACVTAMLSVMPRVTDAPRGALQELLGRQLV
jgi:putative nucleotidyltransferase with HDIG domain